MTQTEVAEELDWSPSKILRIENGQSALTVSDLHALIAVYPGLREIREELLALARDARRSSLASQYSDVFPLEFREWLDFEAYASTIRQFEPQLVPGALQIDEYAVPLVTALLGGDSAKNASDLSDAERRLITKAERIAEARNARTEVLLGEDGPTMDFIIDEAALRRATDANDGRSGYRAMVAQLRHLMKMNTVGRRARGEKIEPDLNPRISIQIVPFSMGHYLVMRQPFEIIEFRCEDEPYMMFFEDPEGDQVIRDKYDEIANYIDHFSRLKKDLPGPDKTNGLIERCIAVMTERGDTVI